LAKKLSDIVPDVDLLLSLEPEAIGGVILEFLNGLPPDEQQQLNRYNMSISDLITAGYRPQMDKAIRYFHGGVDVAGAPRFHRPAAR
jgi:hypothetical protein